MTRINNDNLYNNNNKKKQCLLALFRSKCVDLFEKVYTFDFDMFKNFRIDIGPAVINTIQCLDLGPLVCGSTQILTYKYQVKIVKYPYTQEPMGFIGSVMETIKRKARFLFGVTYR